MYMPQNAMNLSCTAPFQQEKHHTQYQEVLMVCKDMDDVCCTAAAGMMHPLYTLTNALDSRPCEEQ